jgi:uncharacterized protein
MEEFCFFSSALLPFFPLRAFVPSWPNKIMEEKIIYFEKAGVDNTTTVLDLVKAHAQAKGIRKIVVASTRGGTARAAMDAFRGTDIQLIVVPWQYGFGEHHEIGQQPFPETLVNELHAQGHRVHFGTMLFHTDKLYGTTAPQALANILRVFGQGFKVCVEIVLMAADGGCVAKGEKVIVVAGTGVGADTAMVATVAPSVKLSALRIHEILCKPL